MVFGMPHVSNLLAGLRLPCGRCVGCRLDRSVQMAVRCVHEAQLHEHSSFVTLTYRPEKLASVSLVYEDFQLFMKRLRHWRVTREAVSVCGPAPAKGAVRYYMCGEYGGQYFRPHFHALLFGVTFPNQELLKRMPSGNALYRSPTLERLWPDGFSSIGSVNFDSAAYVARYATKSAVTGEFTKRQRTDRGFVDTETGEFVPMTPEFNRMSLKPGLGAKWYEKYHGEVFPQDRVIMNGQRVKPPKYYKTLLARADLFRAAMVDAKRLLENQGREAEQTPARLAAMEAVTKARLFLKKRGIS